MKRGLGFRCSNYNDTMGFNIQKNVYGNTDFFITLGTKEFSFESDWPNKIDSHIGAGQYTIQNQLYFDVLQFKNWIHPHLNTPYSCYYNITNGIVKIETAQGNLELYKMTTK